MNTIKNKIKFTFCFIVFLMLIISIVEYRRSTNNLSEAEVRLNELNQEIVQLDEPVIRPENDGKKVIFTAPIVLSQPAEVPAGVLMSTGKLVYFNRIVQVCDCEVGARGSRYCWWKLKDPGGNIVTNITSYGVFSAGEFQNIHGSRLDMSHLGTVVYKEDLGGPNNSLNAVFSDSHIWLSQTPDEKCTSNTEGLFRYRHEYMYYEPKSTLFTWMGLQQGHMLLGLPDGKIGILNGVKQKDEVVAALNNDYSSKVASIQSDVDAKRLGIFIWGFIALIILGVKIYSSFFSVKKKDDKQPGV